MPSGPKITVRMLSLLHFNNIVIFFASLFAVKVPLNIFDRPRAHSRLCLVSLVV